MILPFYRKIFDSKRYRLNFSLFILAWVIVNILQASFSELAHDEAYYWMYSRKLAWGYFDHPPIIALLVKIGYGLFRNELGVRLLTTILGASTLIILFHLIDSGQKSIRLFIIIVTSIVLVQSHVGGFLAIPDIPVVFFAALFLLVYKEYCRNDSYLLATLMGVVGTLMLYSKYHGILILLFTLAANLKVVRRLSFWIVPVIIAGLMLPHLFWQIKNGFPTFTYHLVSRSSVYKLDHTINYLYSQFLVAGPFVSIVVLYQAFKFRAGTPFETVLKVNMVGIFVFFLLMSLKGHVEAHWTALAFIPLVVLSHKAIQQNGNAQRWMKRLFIPSLMLIFFIRSSLIFDFIPSKVQPLREMHGWDRWAEEINSVAGDRPVLFVNSFQRPSKYTFYTQGKFAHTLNNIYYRKNQFDLWPIEDSIQHKSVLLLSSRTPEDTLETSIGESYNFEFDTSFVSYYNLVTSIGHKQITVGKGDTMSFDLVVYNPRMDTIRFNYGDGVGATFHDGERWLKQKNVLHLFNSLLFPCDSLYASIRIDFPVTEGNYDLYVTLFSRNQLPALNSAPVKVKIR